jgi:hypothetical protein
MGGASRKRIPPARVARAGPNQHAIGEQVDKKRDDGFGDRRRELGFRRTG